VATSVPAAVYAIPPSSPVPYATYWTGNAWSSKAGTSYNSVTGRVSAGQKASVSNVYTGGWGSVQNSGQVQSL
jgi:hypothetical protein